MKIREMRERDLEAVLDVVESHDEEDAQAAQEYFEELFDLDDEEREEVGDQHFVALDDAGEVIGVGGAMEDNEEGYGIWWLGWFYVHPDHQHQGVGAALLERSLAWAREHEGRKMYVDVSSLPEYENARRFYAKHGFSEEGRLKDYYDEGEDCLLLGRRI